jgi:O-antigen/teichoic acid export membrane protein
VSPGRRDPSAAKLRPSRAPAAAKRRTPRDELADSTAHGLVYLRRLRRAQLALSLLALIAFGALFGVLPITLYLLPHLHHWTLLGIPVTVWVLVVPLSPLFLVIGWIYARRADSLDAAFRDLVEK